MAKIEVISTTIIQPKTTSTHKKNKKIDLTSNDVPFLLVGPIQKGLIFSEPFSSEFHQTLQASLSKTLDIFFPLAGRFSTTQSDNNNTVVFSIDCNDAGVHYVRAVAGEVTVSDILDPVYVPHFVQSFFPLNGFKNHQGTSNPLLAVQVTELSDGIFIGCTVNHSVSDGATFWNFMNCCSEICRCFPDGHITKTLPTPVFENWFRGGNDCPVKLPASIFKTDHLFTPAPPLQERIFNFSKEKMAELKEKANSEVGHGTSLEKRKIVISSLHSLLAHIWRSVIRSGSGQLDQESGGDETTVQVLVGLRSILEIPEGYFGNAIQSATMRMKVKELEEKGIGEVALAIEKTVGNFTEEIVRKDPSESTTNPEILRLGGLIITSNPKFNIYGNDFGWGKPVAVRSGVSHKFDGMITLYPGVEEGSLDVEICSSLQALEALAIDSEFMDFVTI